MLWIGITGPMGSGKSSVSDILRQIGYTVFDADQVVHSVLSPGGDTQTEIFHMFGEHLRGPGGHLDRRRLGAEVFTDPAKLAQLEALLHPKVRARVAELKAAAAARGERVAFYDVPLLFEKKMEDQFDAVWVVSAPRDLRMARVRARTGLSETEVEARWRQQLPPEYKESRADVLIQNAGSLADLKTTVLQQVNKSSLPSPTDTKSEN